MFYVQNYEFWSFGENPHIFKLTPITVYPHYLNEQLRQARHNLKRGVATMPLLFLLL